jgi:electron transport complex protein RnfD
MGKLTINSSPHTFSPVDTRSLMKDVVVALIPAVIVGLYFFRLQALSVIIAAVSGCLLTEYGLQRQETEK